MLCSLYHCTIVQNTNTRNGIEEHITILRSSRTRSLISINDRVFNNSKDGTKLLEVGGVYCRWRTAHMNSLSEGHLNSNWHELWIELFLLYVVHFLTGMKVPHPKKTQKTILQSTMSDIIFYKFFKSLFPQKHCNLKEQ